jgi:hypothetical protein
MWNDPGSAVHRSALHCVREKDQGRTILARLSGPWERDPTTRNTKRTCNLLSNRREDTMNWRTRFAATNVALLASINTPELKEQRNALVLYVFGL